MRSRPRELVVPAYLLACLLLGGSPQGTWRILVLQLLGLALLAWAGMTRTPEPLSRAGRYLLLLAGGAALLVLVQLTPLPPAVWSALPGRESIVAGYELLGQPLPWLPSSLTPYATLDSFLFLIPPCAIVAGTLRLGAYRSAYLAAAILLATLAGILLGAVQVSANTAYLYPLVTRGQASGLFANANYMGTLLLTAVPFIAALASRCTGDRGGATKLDLGRTGIAISLVLIVLIGLGLSLSLAAVALSIPVIAASALLLVQRRRKVPLWAMAGALVTAIIMVGVSSALPALRSGGNLNSMNERVEIYRTTGSLVRKVLPVGSGLGSFRPLYAQAERSEFLGRTYVNHAHNDYLELVMEGGIPALLLLLAGLFWWARRSWSIWRLPAAGSLARAATIASAAILLHSLVDFPARTVAISAVLATCFALMAEPRGRSSATTAATQPARHLRL